MSISLADLRTVLGKTNGQVSLADAYGIDIAGKNNGEITLAHVKGAQVQPFAYQSFSPQTRSSVLGMYSVKLVNTNYAGPALSVKRVSDNATVNFFSDLTGNLKDSTGTSYSAWIGASIGQITTWYDQSGAGRHATVPSTALPPRLALDPVGTSKYVVFYANEKLTDPDLKIRVNYLNTTPSYNSTGASAPTFQYNSGNGYVQFAPGSGVDSSSPSAQFMNFGTQTFNIGTKGFTATCQFSFSSTVGAWERILDFGNGAPNDNIIINRYSNTTNLQLNYYIGTTSCYMISTYSFAQNTVYKIAAVYNPSVGTYGTFYLYVNGVLQQSAEPIFQGTVSKATDRTLTNCYVGKSAVDGTWSALAFNGNIYSLRVYNRVLTAAEIADPTEYGVTFSGFTVASQPVTAMMCNFYGIENAYYVHTFLGSTGDMSLRAYPTNYPNGAGQQYNISNNNDTDFHKTVGGYTFFNGAYKNTTPYITYSNSSWNTIACSRNSGTVPITYIGMMDPVAANYPLGVMPGRAFNGYMSDMFTFNAALPTSSAAGDANFSPEYKIFHKQALASMQSGLVGRYTAESWTGTQWLDTSGVGNHATSVTGAVSKTSLTSRSGMAGGIEYLFGNTGASITFPAAILPSTYTLFHVARYNGATQKRLFTHSSQNWISGFWNGASGVAYRGNKWLNSNPSTNPTTRHGSDWVLSTDQNNLYRSFGAQRSVTGAAAGSVTTVTPLNLNYGIDGGSGLNDQSDWAAACVLVFNRTLSLAEYLSVEDYLASKYKIPIPIHEGLVLSLDASDYLAANGTTWFDKTINGYNFTLTNAVSWNNTLSTYPFPYFAFTNSTNGNVTRFVSSARTDVPIPASTVKHVTVVLFTMPISSSTTYRTLLRGTLNDHHVIIDSGTDNLGMYNNDGTGIGFVPCDNNVNISTLKNSTSTFNMWVFQISSVAPYYRFFYNPSALPLLPVGEIASNAAATLGNGFADLGGTQNLQHWGNIASFAYYHRRLADEELVNMYNRYQAKYDLPTETGHHQIYSPYMWFRAEDLSSLAQGAGVSSWPCVGPVYNRVASGLAAGNGGFPIFHKTTETLPFVRLGTDTESTANGSYFNCGAQTMNMGSKNGFTFVGYIRFRSTALWEMVFDFNLGGPGLNNVAFARNARTSYVDAVHYSNIGYETTADTTPAITGGWQTFAMRITEVQVTAFYGASGIYTANSASLANRSFTQTWIGRSSWSGNSYANIDIRDLAFYDYALSDEQITNVRTYFQTKAPLDIPKPLTSALSTAWSSVATSGLQLWLDMSLPQSYDGSSTTTINDISGNGRHFTLAGSGYSWSSAGYLRIAPTTTTYADGPPNSAFGITVDHTVEVVVQPYLNGSVGYTNTFVWFADAGAVNNRMLNVHLPWTDNTAIYDSMWGASATSNRTSYAVTTPGAQKHYVFRTRTSAGATYIEIFENGILKAGPTTITPAGTWGGISRLFSDQWVNTSFWRGLFYYMRVYNKALTDAEVLQNYTYAKKKYLIP